MTGWRDGLRALRRGDVVPVPAPSQGAHVALSRADVEAVLARQELITMDFQPILDVRSARTAGWEALARFGRARPGQGCPGPDEWFAAAHRVGLGVQLETAAIRRGLSALRMRTPGTFLSVNVSPAALDDPGVLDLIAGSAPLSGLVIELTEHTTPPRPGPWRVACRRLHELGAIIAIDDIGKGYAEMLQILELHPQIIKIDRSLVTAVPDDPAHRALLRFLGLFAGEIDAWLLAEGVETPAQLQALTALGVPLAQGWYIGRPDCVPRPCRVEVTAVCDRRRTDPGPRSPAATMTGTDVLTRAGVDVTVADVMRSPAPGTRWSIAALRVPADLPLTEAARRALTRPCERRYDTLQCLGPGGDVVGELPAHDLFLALVEIGSPSPTG